MTNWLEALSDTRGISAIFGGDVPALDRVAMQEISLNRDGPSATLRFDLPGYPASPPAKWLAQGFNVVQVTLLLVGVQDLSIQGWSHQGAVDLELSRDGSTVVARGSSESMRLDVRADAAVITSLSAYQDELAPSRDG
jgi:hypothetical protein